jgi:hypothetical protein
VLHVSVIAQGRCGSDPRRSAAAARPTAARIDWGTSGLIPVIPTASSSRPSMMDFAHAAATGSWFAQP